MSKTLKRILLAMVAVIMSLVLCFSMTACSNDKDDDKKDKDDDKPAETEVVEDEDKEVVEDEEEEEEEEKASTDDAEEVADALMQAAYVDFDADEVVALMHDDVNEYVAEEAGLTVDEYIEELQKVLDGIETSFSEADEYEITWTIDEVEELEDTDLEDCQEEYEELYGLDVEKATVVYITLNMEATVDGEEKSNSTDNVIPVVLIDGKWYVDPSAVN